MHNTRVLIQAPPLYLNQIGALFSSQVYYSTSACTLKYIPLELIYDGIVVLWRQLCRVENVIFHVPHSVWFGLMAVDGEL